MNPETRDLLTVSVVLAGNDKLSISQQKAWLAIIEFRQNGQQRQGLC